jgi:hypothetical protein
MDLDDDTLSCASSTDIDSVEDIEYELENLNEYGNEKQLSLLTKEITHIIAHGIQPSEGWYDERYKHIHLYSQLSWEKIADEYNNDYYMYNNIVHIIRLIDDLLEERGSKPNFNLNIYLDLLYSIKNIWNYYKNTYDNEDVIDLMDSMKIM